MTHLTYLKRLHALNFFVYLSLLASAASSLGLAQEPPKITVQDPDKRKVKFDFLGDTLPPHALLRFGTNRFNPSCITQVSLSPDNKSVVTLGIGLHSWDSMTGKELWNRDLACDEHISCAAYGVQMMVRSPSGNLVACGSDGEIVILDFLDGKTMQTIDSAVKEKFKSCLLYTSPSPRDRG